MGDLTRNFSNSEFSCKCGCGFDDISLELVAVLQAIRDITGPLKINSGCRCEAYNKSIGGKELSAHPDGDAADLHCISSTMRFQIIDTALQLGVSRIGVYKNFIHLDLSNRLPLEVIW